MASMAFRAHRQSHLSSLTTALFDFLLLALSVFAVENQPNNQPDANGWIYNQTTAPWPGLSRYGQIRCVGKWPEFRREFGDASIGRIQSLLQFCAEPGFGGAMRFHPAHPTVNGAFCAWWLDIPRIVISRKFQPETSSAWKRDILCQTKCTCEFSALSPAADLLGDEQNRRLESLQGDHDHMYLSVGLSVGQPSRPINKNNVRHAVPLYLSRNGFSVDYRADPETGVARLEPESRLMRKITISGLFKQELTCFDAQLPPFPLPAIYSNVKQLCSANFLGGHPTINAGGICIDSNTNLVQYREEFSNPIFSSSLVRWGGWEATAAFITMHWCISSCSCAAPDFKGKVRKPITKIKGHGDLIKGADGSFAVKWKKTRDNPAKTITIAGPSSAFDASTSKHCATGRDGQTWCFADLAPGELEPSPMYGPQDLFPHFGHYSADIDTLPDGVCDNPCERPADCNGCICMIDQDSPEKITESYDPLAGSVLRYAVSAICASTLTMNQKLGGRAETQAAVCACNGTYISAGCCGSEDGLLWESRDRKWGEMRV
jgi:hypothetical protein